MDTPNLRKEDERLLRSEADKHFRRLSGSVSNGDLLMEILELEDGNGSEFVVHRLIVAERQTNLFWEDRELSAWLDEIAKRKAISLKDPVDRQRWLALICIAAAKKEEFPHNNVVIAPDYLPTESREFRQYEDVYGSGLLGDIQEQRESIKRNRLAP